ncbi:unnamed protein product [Caenorhabditis auriculariae]|uniref:Uncharacterized protein n=1 Tax=Caenorhabditis auriculariae TaxID=2777116 RepID=A0A8S1HJJ0_9PELO|nr:unnamed protein product [Caenorhabditis auriculariae]
MTQKSAAAIFSLLAVLVGEVAGLVCPIPTVAGGLHRNKTCPDFKADPTFVHCCTSKLPPTNTQLREKHGVYCCSLADFEKEQQEAAAAEFRGFVKDYFALIVFGTVLVASLCVIFMAIICKRIPGCPMYRNIQLMSHPTEPTSGMYRPVDTIPPKMYEAPPPYECFVPPPVLENNDWNCILENEVNGSRRTPPQEMADAKEDIFKFPEVPDELKSVIQKPAQAPSPGKGERNAVPGDLKPDIFAFPEPPDELKSAKQPQVHVPVTPPNPRTPQKEKPPPKQTIEIVIINNKQPSSENVAVALKVTEPPKNEEAPSQAPVRGDKKKKKNISRSVSEEEDNKKVHACASVERARPKNKRKDLVKRIKSFINEKKRSKEDVTQPDK